MSLVMADQESRGIKTDDSGADEEDSVMRENLAEGGGAVNAESNSRGLSISFIWSVWLDQIDETDQIDQMD